MKKLVFASLSVFFALGVSAQNGKVISAYNYMSSYEQKEGAPNLEQAAQSIDIAAQDESTSKSSKTWWYRAKIYQYIASEPMFKDKYPKASLEAALSFQTLQKLNEPKFKDWSDAVQNMKALTVNLFNDGVSAYQAKKYPEAYQFFSAIGDLTDVIKARGEKVNDNVLNMAIRNAALSAENSGDNAGAVASYQKQMLIAPDSIKASIYQSEILLYKKMKNDSAARRLTDEAIAKYPEDGEIIIDKINYFFIDKKQGEAIDYLKKLAAKDPKNEEVLYNLAVAYETIGDSVVAQKTYESVLTINPDNFKANLGLGAFLFNKANAINKVMNALSMSAADQKKFDVLKVQRNALFTAARPYLLKAQAKKPDDGEVNKALTTIDALTK